MIEDLDEAKQRLRTAWGATRPRASRSPDVAEAKAGLRSAAISLPGFGVAAAERIAVEQLGEWVHQSPWQAVLTAFLTGTVLGGRDAVPLYLITRIIDIAAAESVRARSRNTAPEAERVRTPAAASH